jgi:uncharacterized small protein (TIGR04563 family)
MTTTDKRKRSLYFPDTILREMQTEAKRQERSLSWIVQYAWRIARADLMRLPSVGDANFKDGQEDDHLDDLVEHDHDSHAEHEPFNHNSAFSHHNG